MRMFSRLLLMLVPLPCFLFGQSWEVGGSGGFGVYHNLNVTSGSASGTAGFDSGFALGGVIGNNMGRWLGGEARYTYRSDDLQVSSGSTKAKATANSQAIHYDLLVYGASKEASVRPFVSAGAGVKLYRGTGAEPVFQPLSNLVVLTHTNEAQPLISLGGGVKIPVSRGALIRLDFRDYLTPVPTSLLATPANSRISGWLHDFVFLVGISAVL